MSTSARDTQIEPELRLPTPRRIRRKRGAARPPGWNIGMVCSLLFPVPFLAVGFSLLAQTAQTAFVLYAGTVTTGQVVDHTFRSGDDEGNNGASSYLLTYTFTVGGRSYRASDRVNAGFYSHVTTGKTIKVRYEPLAPGWDSVAADGTNARTGFVSLIFGSALWNAMISIFPLAFTRWIKEERRFVRFGIPVIGTITRRWYKDDQGTETYHVTYSYTDEALIGTSRPPREATVKLSLDEWENVREGERLTILYLAEKPQSSTIYRFRFFQPFGRVQ